MLSTLTHAFVVWTRPHAAASAATDGATVIWLELRLTQAERRCAPTHEFVHLGRGHRGCQPPAVEHTVRASAARQVITLEQRAEAPPWSMSLDELADELWVTPFVLTDRLAGLTWTERDHLVARIPEHCDTV